MVNGRVASVICSSLFPAVAELRLLEILLIMSSWLRCVCGNLLHTNLFAGAGVFKLILDEDFNQLTEPFDTDAVSHLFGHGRTMYRCSHCDRLYVQWERGGELTIYAPEQPNKAGTPKI